MGRRTAAIAVLLGACAIAACGGDGDGSDEAAADGIAVEDAIDIGVADRCHVSVAAAAEKPGCSPESALAPGTAFVDEDESSRWALRYVDSRVQRRATSDPANPEQLSVIAEIEVTLEEADGPLAFDEQFPDSEGLSFPFAVEAAVPGSSLEDCGTSPQAPVTFEVGDPVTWERCLTYSGPPSSLRPLGLALVHRYGGTAYLAVRD